MVDHIVDANRARDIQSNAAGNEMPLVWIVAMDLPEYPNKLVARLITPRPEVYVMVADTLDELRIQLPPGLRRSEPRLNDPPKVVEVWFRAIC
jgi:hypothetical protein